MYIKRQIEQQILKIYKDFPVSLIIGPRQSGKTTLVKHLFPEFDYYNLEQPDIRRFARDDPKSFITNFDKGIIIDEIQNFPELLSYIQVYVDETGILGKFILTSSQNLLLNQQISQTLSGRVAIFTLLPLSVEELKSINAINDNYEQLIFKGFYPRIWATKINSLKWYADYISTYVERDVRMIINIKDFNKFHDFLKLLSARIGQIINYSSIANELNVDVKTVSNWVSLLEQTFIVFRVQPFYKNFGKRIIKSPKIYFYDTGLACYLLELDTYKRLKTFYLRGELFENLIMSEIKKMLFNCGVNKSIYFWRDKTGNEVDLVLETSQYLLTAEIKAKRTLNFDVKAINKFSDLAKNTKKIVVYGGDIDLVSKEVFVISWKNLFSKFGLKFQICPKLI